MKSQLEEAGEDDTESRGKVTEELADAKNRIDAINTSIQSQTRKTEMANALLNKKPSLNGEGKPVEEKPVGEGFFEGWGFDDKPEGKPEGKPEEEPKEPQESKVNKVRRRLGIMRDKDMIDDEDFDGMSELLDIKDEMKEERHETLMNHVKTLVDSGYTYEQAGDILKNPTTDIKELQAMWAKR